MKFQFGYDLTLFIFWRTVAPEKFAPKVRPMLLKPTQFDHFTDSELLSLFSNGNLCLRDGWRLYRGVKI